MLDHFQGGPNLVRGFAPAGFGPRDITQLAFGYGQNDALGGSLYWASSLEFQTPMFFLPKEFGMVNAIDCRSENSVWVGEVWNWRAQKVKLHP